jgi:hypothetical protein
MLQRFRESKNSAAQEVRIDRPEIGRNRAAFMMPNCHKLDQTLWIKHRARYRTEI